MTHRTHDHGQNETAYQAAVSGRTMDFQSVASAFASHHTDGQDVRRTIVCHKIRRFYNAANVDAQVVRSVNIACSTYDRLPVGRLRFRHSIAASIGALSPSVL